MLFYALNLIMLRTVTAEEILFHYIIKNSDLSYSFKFVVTKLVVGPVAQSV